MQIVTEFMTSMETEGYDYNFIINITRKYLRIASFLREKEFNCDFVVSGNDYAEGSCGKLAAIVREIAII